MTDLRAEQFSTGEIFYQRRDQQSACSFVGELIMRGVSFTSSMAFLHLHGCDYRTPPRAKNDENARNSEPRAALDEAKHPDFALAPSEASQISFAYARMTLFVG